MMNLITPISRTLTILLLTTLHTSIFAHEGHGSKAPWDACQDKALQNQCSFTNGHGDLYQGTCQAFSYALMCVRNVPIIKAADLKKIAPDKAVIKKQEKIEKIEK